MYASLLVEAIKGIEEENQGARAQADDASNGQETSADRDRAGYMGWIIDDFPGTVEQVRQYAIIFSFWQVVIFSNNFWLFAHMASLALPTKMPWP